jgi:hypothetical protein
MCDILSNANDFFKKAAQTQQELTKIVTVIEYHREIYDELLNIYKELLIGPSHREQASHIDTRASCQCFNKKSKRDLDLDMKNKIVVYSPAYNNVERGVFTERYKALKSILDLCKHNESLDIHAFTIKTSYADKELKNACKDTFESIQKELVAIASQCDKYQQRFNTL